MRAEEPRHVDVIEPQKPSRNTLLQDEPVLIGKNAWQQQPDMHEVPNGPKVFNFPSVYAPAGAGHSAAGTGNAGIAISTPSVSSEAMFQTPTQLKHFAGRHPTQPGYHRPTNSHDLRDMLREKPMPSLPSPAQAQFNIPRKLPPVEDVRPPSRSSSLRRKKKKNQIADLSSPPPSDPVSSPVLTLQKIDPDVGSAPFEPSPALRSIELPSWDGSGSLPVPPRRLRKGANVSSEGLHANAESRPALTVETFNPPDTSVPFRTPTMERIERTEYFGDERGEPESQAALGDISREASQASSQITKPEDVPPVPALTPSSATFPPGSGGRVSNSMERTQSRSGRRSMHSDVHTASSSSSFQEGREVWNMDDDGENFEGLFFSGQRSDSRSGESANRSPSSRRRSLSSPTAPEKASVPPPLPSLGAGGLFRKASRVRRTSLNVADLFNQSMPPSLGAPDANASTSDVFGRPSGERWRLGRIGQTAEVVTQDPAEGMHSQSAQTAMPETFDGDADKTPMLLQADPRDVSPTDRRVHSSPLSAKSRPESTSVDEGRLAPPLPLSPSRYVSSQTRASQRVSTFTDDSGDALSIVHTSWPRPPDQSSSSPVRRNSALSLAEDSIDAEQR